MIMLTALLAALAPLHEPTIVFDHHLPRGGVAPVYVRVQAAHDLRDLRPVEGARAFATLSCDDGPSTYAAAETQPGGDAVLWVPVSDGDAEARCALVVQTWVGGLGHTQRFEARAWPARVLQLRTDRWLYRPAEPLRWRLRAARLTDARPLPQQGLPLRVTAGGAVLWEGEVVTGSRGVAEGEVPLPRGASGPVRLEIGAAERPEATREVFIYTPEGPLPSRPLPDHPLERAVSAGTLKARLDGARINLRLGEAPRGVEGTLLASAHRGRFALTYARLDPRRRGGAATLLPPPGAVGLHSLRVIDTGRWGHDHHGGVALPGRPLSIHLDLEDRRALIHVTDAAGAPAPGVGLTVTIVPAAVASLGGRGPSLTQRLVEQPSPSPPRARVFDAPSRRRAHERDRLGRARPQVIDALRDHGGALARFAPREGWVMTTRLAELGVTGDPWGRPTRWGYAKRHRDDFEAGRVLRDVADARLWRLAGDLHRAGDGVKARIRRRGRRALPALVEAGLVHGADLKGPWGAWTVVRTRRGRTSLQHLGPDGRLDTADDRVVEDIFSSSGEGGISGACCMAPHGYRGGSVMASRLGQISWRRDHLEAARGATLVWRGDLVTDAEGHVGLAVPAPPVTADYLVELEAHGPDGGLGRYAKTHALAP